MAGKTLISFDYAIKFLLKDRSGYEIVEGFISSLLQSEGYGPVKIKMLLESESNREEADLKKSVADVVVEDEQGNSYIVEIERSFTASFIHKACFNSSRLIIDSVKGGSDFSTIKKIFHITILYFEWNQMKTPVYHAQMVANEVGSHTPLDLEFFDTKGTKFEVHDVFPEFFFICVPLFNDVIKQELDEWLYVMKNSEIKDDFKSPYMKQVEERLSILKMNQEERYAYIKYGKEACSQRDIIAAAEEKGEMRGLEKGREQGLEQGKNEEKRDIARNLLAIHIPPAKIAEVTGLSVEEIEKIGC